MKIVLREHVDHLGERGDIVNVAAGYARNFLLPKRLAFEATPGNLKVIEQQRRVWAARETKELNEAEALARQIAATQVVVTKKAGESGTLYGWVTHSEIAEILATKGIVVDRRRIQGDAIKSIGEHEVGVRIHPRVTGKLVVRVEAEVTTAEVEWLASGSEPASPIASFEEETSGTDPRLLLAIVAAWCCPGLGHVLLGRVRRGVLFAALLLGSFGLGVAHDGRLALRDQRQPFLTTLQIVANAGIGPLDLAARFWVYGEAAYRLPIAARGAVETGITEVFRDRTKSGLSIYGTAYLWTAGLMNLLLLFDVWDIGKGRKG